MIVANGAIQRLIRSNVELWLIAVQGRQRRLRIEIDSKHPITLERQKLGEMRGRRRLARAAFEIDDRKDLALLIPGPLRTIALTFPALFQKLTQFVDLVESV